jgi:hypothetical protein
MDLLTVLQHKLFLEEFWREWFTVEYGFGREVFQDKTRVFIDSYGQFTEYVEWCKATRSPCWMSVQPFKARNQVFTVEKLFFDFDGSLIKAWKEASTFTQHLKQYYGAEAFIAFSGCKGYHVYVWLATPQHFMDSKQAKMFYATAQKLLLKGLQFETLDQQVIGDIKRVSRVPYSIHEKSGNPCVPLTVDHAPLLISSLKGFREGGLSDRFVKLCLKQIQKEPDKRRLILRHKNVKGVRPCVSAALDKQLEGKGGHLMRLAIAIEHLHLGMQPSEIAVLFRSQSDYDYGKSLDFVEDAQKRGYKPFKCKTIQALGFCLPDCRRRHTDD